MATQMVNLTECPECGGEGEMLYPYESHPKVCPVCDGIKVYADCTKLVEALEDIKNTLKEIKKSTCRVCNGKSHVLTAERHGRSEKYTRVPCKYCKEY